jgi:hypothetical protein
MDSATCLNLLTARQQADGGFAPRDARESRPDATAWGVLALSAAPRPNLNSIEMGRRRLAAVQLPDGRVPITPNHVNASWPTALALLAWYGWRGNESAAVHGLDFLGRVTVATFKTEDAVNAIDSTLNGWSWIEGTSCWVEPTSLAVFAFDRYHRETDRVGQGVKLLLNRQLPHGGWNFGNTLVFGTELLPSEEYVGVALTGLAGHCPPEQVAQSIAFLEQRLPKLRTPLALGWGILGLSAWGRRPAEASAWISQCLDRQSQLGPFDTVHLALMLLAEHCVDGLSSIFPPLPA